MKLIDIRTTEGLRQIAVRRIGHMAAHGRAMSTGQSETEFSVTHMPSGITFAPCFQTIDSAIAAAREINALRLDWLTFDPKLAAIDNSFKKSLRAIYQRHGGITMPPFDGDRRAKVAMQSYSNDLNGYGGAP